MMPVLLEYRHCTSYFKTSWALLHRVCMWNILKIVWGLKKLVKKFSTRVLNLVRPCTPWYCSTRVPILNKIISRYMYCTSGRQKIMYVETFSFLSFKIMPFWYLFSCTNIKQVFCPKKKISISLACRSKAHFDDPDKPNLNGLAI